MATEGGVSDSVPDGPTQSQLPTALVLNCGGGGGILAATDFLEMVAATDHDWNARDYVRKNEIRGALRLVRTAPGRAACEAFLWELQPEVVVVDASRKAVPASDDRFDNVSVTAAGIVDSFVTSGARLLILECVLALLNSRASADQTATGLM